MGVNDLDDESLDKILGYAKKDVWLDKILVQGNSIQVGPSME